MEINQNISMTGGLAQPLAGSGEAVTVEAEYYLHRRESIIRLALGWILCLGGLVSLYGIAWDVQWHTIIGRDNFWTPPHWIIYTLVAGEGAITAGFVLLETFRYYRRSPAVTSKTTSAFLGIFHAPLGFYMTGFGLLSSALAAPLDDYWHQLYGIDLAIWTPFHMMGIIGGIFTSLGIVLIFASEHNRINARGNLYGRNERGLRWVALSGVAAGLCFVMGQSLLLVEPSFFPPTNMVYNFWGWHPTVYNTLIILVIPPALVAAVMGTGRVGMATLTALLFTLLRFAFENLIPWANNSLIASEGYEDRTKAISAIFPIPVGVPETFPVYMVLYGVLVDLAFLGMVWLWGRRGKSFRTHAFNFNRWRYKDNTAEGSEAKNLARWLFSPWWLAGLVAVIAVLMLLLEQPYNQLVEAARRLAALSAFSRAVPRQYLTFIVPDVATTLPLVLAVGLVVGLLSRYVGFALRYENH